MSWDVNKLARREYDYIRGNTVLAPERKRKIVRKPDKKYKQIQRKRKIDSKILLEKKQRANDRKYLLTIAGIIVTLGFITISGDNKVYDIEKSLNTVNSQISQTEEENEALKVKILKYSSLNNVETNAESKLSMFVPSKNDTVKIDFSQDYFKDIKTKSSESNTKGEGLFSKIISFIK
ncbi:cell division protein FtsL [Clostridium sp. DL-VIII]|uniref:cell division protein FtsL n=1 Tax=Clostridium sp. DL-VIII TaxID=641107 RepID=UPI00163EF515|nr:cell division protein FtsL [Clostridium sp. DL-VIII]